MSTQVLPQVKADHTSLGWLVVLSASLFFFYEFIQLNLFNAIDRQLMQFFHIDAAKLGQLSSMYFYSQTIFLFPAGILLDRYSTKFILLCAIISSTIGTYIFALSDSYFYAAVGRFIVGTGASFCFLSCVRIASRWFPPSKMAFVIGMVVTMAMLGGLVAQTPFAVLCDVIGWRHALLADATLGIFVTLVILFFVQDRPPNSQKETFAEKAQLEKLGFWHSIGLALTNKYNWFGGIYTSLMNLPVFLLGALFGIHYLMQVHNLTSVQASYATTMFFVGVIFGAPAFGWFSDHLGRRVLPMLIGAVASLVVILALMYVPDLSLSSLIALFFLVGFMTSSQVLSYPAIAELNPISLTSTSLSIASVMIMVSGWIAQPLFGWMMEVKWDHLMADGAPVYAAGDFMNAMLIIPVAFVLSLLFAWMIKETFCKSQA